MLKAKTRGANVMALLWLKRGHAGVTARRVKHGDSTKELHTSSCGLLKST